MSRPSERIMDGSMKQQQTSPRSIMLRTLDKINTISDSLPSTNTFGTNQTISMPFIDSTHRYVSRTFKFIIKEFQASEDAGERVWITGAVLSGWDVSYPLMDPTVSFLQNDQPILSRRNCEQSLGPQPRGPDYDILSQQWQGLELQHC